MQPATNWPTTDRTPGRSSHTSGIEIFSTAHAIRTWRRAGSRISGGIDINPPVAVRTALLRGPSSAIGLILKEIRNFRGLGLQPHKPSATVQASMATLTKGGMGTVRILFP